MSSLTPPCMLTHTDSPDLTRKIYPLSTHYSSVIDEPRFSEYCGTTVLTTCCFDPLLFIYVRWFRSPPFGQTNTTRGAPMDSGGTSLNKGSCAVTERDDSLLTTETDAVLQVDDSLICLIPPSSWKRSPTGPPKGVGVVRFRMSSRFPEGSKKDLSPQLMLLACCCGLKFPFYMPFGKGNTCRPLMSLKFRHVGQPESLTGINSHIKNSDRIHKATWLGMCVPC